MGSFKMSYRPQTPGIVLKRDGDKLLAISSSRSRKNLSTRSRTAPSSQRSTRSKSSRDLSGFGGKISTSRSNGSKSSLSHSLPPAIVADKKWDASLKNISSTARHRLAVSHAARVHHKMMLDKICNRLADQAHRQYPSLRVLYNKLDGDGDGIIDKGEFVKGLRTNGFRLANEDASLVFDMVDFNGDGMMAFDEFCSIFNPKNVRYSNERLKLHEHVRFKDTSFHISDLRNNLPEVDPIQAERLRDRLQQKIVNKEKDAKVTPTLLKAFKTFDPRQDGFISYDEFKRAMGTSRNPPGLNLGLKEDEIVQLISLVDADRDGVITLKEFITSLSKSTVLEDFVGRIKRMERDGLRNRVVAPLRKELQALAKLYETTINDEMKAYYEEGQTKPIPKDVANRVLDMLRARCSAAGKIRKVFRRYDEDKSGMISPDELRKVLLNLGVKLNDTETSALFHIFDSNGDGGIKYDEFTNAVFAPSRTLENNDKFNLNVNERDEKKSLEFANMRNIGSRNDLTRTKKSLGQFAESRHETIAGHDSLFKRDLDEINDGSKVEDGEIETKQNYPVKNEGIPTSALEASKYAQSLRRMVSSARSTTTLRSGNGSARASKPKFYYAGNRTPSISRHDVLFAKSPTKHASGFDMSKYFDSIEHKIVHVPKRYERRKFYEKNTNRITQAPKGSGMYDNSNKRFVTCSSSPNLISNDLAESTKIARSRALVRAKDGHDRVGRYRKRCELTRGMAKVVESERIKAISRTKLGYNEAVTCQEAMAPGRRPGKQFTWNDNGIVLSRGDREYSYGLSASHPW